MLEDCRNAVLPDLYWAVCVKSILYCGLWKSSLPGSCVVFSSDYNLNRIKEKIFFGLYDSLCCTFAKVNLKSLSSVFYIYKRMADLCYKDSL